MKLSSAERIERDSNIAAMYRAGMNSIELGYEFLMTHQNIIVILKELGVPRRESNSQVRWGVTR